MEWRIEKTSVGYYAQRGVLRAHPSISCNFIVYEEARFDTEAQARAYIKRKKG